MDHMSKEEQISMDISAANDEVKEVKKRLEWIRQQMNDKQQQIEEQKEQIRELNQRISELEQKRLGQIETINTNTAREVKPITVGELINKLDHYSPNYAVFFDFPGGIPACIYDFNNHKFAFGYKIKNDDGIMSPSRKLIHSNSCHDVGTLLEMLQDPLQNEDQLEPDKSLKLFNLFLFVGIFPEREDDPKTAIIGTKDMGDHVMLLTAHFEE